MSNTVNPIRVIGVPAYYQGRPNTSFFARYRTLEQRIVRLGV